MGDFDKNSLKFRSPKASKNEGCQNEANIDANTHQKSMLKLVPKKIVTNINFHAFMNGTLCNTVRNYVKFERDVQLLMVLILLLAHRGSIFQPDGTKL